MVDLKLRIQDLTADLSLAGADLELDEGLDTTMLVSLFTERRAGTEDVLPGGESDRRGYWGEDAGDPWGSLLWLLERGKATRDAPNLARGYAYEGLRWLVREGIAEDLQVDAAYSAQGHLLLTVHLTRGTARRWSTLWATPSESFLELGGARIQVIAS